MYFRYFRFLSSTFLRTSHSKHLSLSPIPYIHTSFQNTTTQFPYTPKLTNRPSPRYSTTTTLSLVQYEQLAESTLQSLTEQFDSLPTAVQCSQQYDVNYADGVLTIVVSEDVGTYVINKQTPNRQIWLSSPISGPKRFDMVRGRWVYLHDNTCLHDLLHLEFSAIYNCEVIIVENLT